MSSTPDPTSTPGPGEPDPLRPASDPDTLPSTPGPPPATSPAPGTEPATDPVAPPDGSPDPDTPPTTPGPPPGSPADPNVPDEALDAPEPDETVRGLQSQPNPTDPTQDDPGSMLNY